MSAESGLTAEDSDVNDLCSLLLVTVHEFGHSPDVLVLQFSDVKAVAAEGLQEDGFSLRSHPRLK